MEHLRERFQVIQVHVFQPRIPKSRSVDILRGVSEGSRLSFTLYRIFEADLMQALKAQVPNATITHNGWFRWIGEIFYVDDLCLISTDARVLNTCQTWSENARIQLNADRTRAMCLKPHKSTMQGRDHEKLRVGDGVQHHFTSSPCSQTLLIPLTDLINTQDLPQHSYKK